MGRKPKQGIDFYPMDIGFLHDTKIKRLLQKRGSVGVLIYLSIIDHIYGGTGYYIDDDDDLLYTILDDTSGKYAPDENIVRAVIEDCCSLGLLSRGATSKTITAHRVQVQFYLATKRRTNIQVDRDKWILTKSEMEELGADSPIYRFLISVDKNGIYADKNAIYAGNNPQSKSKSENITHTLSAPTGACEPQAPSVDMVRAYFTARGTTDPIEVTEFIRYNGERGWSCLPAWEQKADLWIAKVPKARREFNERQKREPKKKTPASFDTAAFMEAALRRTYSDNHQ